MNLVTRYKRGQESAAPPARRHRVVFHPQITQMTADYHRLDFRPVIDNRCSAHNTCRAHRVRRLSRIEFQASYNRPCSLTGIMQHGSPKKKSVKICEICGQVPRRSDIALSFIHRLRRWPQIISDQVSGASSMSHAARQASCNTTARKKKSAIICEICGQVPGGATSRCLSSTDYADDRRLSSIEFNAGDR